MDPLPLPPENSGKSTLLSVLLSGHSTPTVPTIGLNVKVVRKSRIEMKVWDIGGAAEYRQEWGRYASGSDVCVFVVDASDPGKLGKVREEMGKLLEDEVVRVMPMLILANKVDIVPHVNEKELVERLGLEEVEETILEDVTDTERKWKSQHHTHNWRPTPISKMNNSSPLHI